MPGAEQTGPTIMAWTGSARSSWSEGRAIPHATLARQKSQPLQAQLFSLYAWTWDVCVSMLAFIVCVLVAAAISGMAAVHAASRHARYWCCH